MALEGSRRVEVTGLLADKRQISATFAVTLSGAFLPMQLLYQGKTNHCHSKFAFPEGFHIHHTPNHWANEETVRLFTEEVIVPCLPRKADSRPEGSSHYGQLQSTQCRGCITTTGR